MSLSFSKLPPLLFHLNIPIHNNDEALQDGFAADHAGQRIAREQLRQGLPAHSAKIEEVHEKMRRLTEQMVRL